jgi:hypothetical protein
MEGEARGTWRMKKNTGFWGRTKERHHLGDLSMDMRNNIKTSVKGIGWESLN